MGNQFELKDYYTMEDLLKIVSILRSPNGCPWDREQTHESIRKNFIEETYEAIEAINKKDNEMLKEELGDVLLQILLHAQMEKEQGTFTFDDVANGIAQKLVLRHPHVFADVSVKDTNEVLRNWDDIKRQSKGQKTNASAMDSVPREFPALMRAQKVQQRAAKDGFDWASVSEIYDKLQEEIKELQDADSQQNLQEELGDVLFSVVNLARFMKMDAEEALTFATDKFAQRYRFVEKEVKTQGKSFQGLTTRELDDLWHLAKQQ